MMDNAISLMIALPLLAAVVAFFAGRLAKYAALIGSLVPLAISLQMFQEFDKTSNAMQFVESYDWVPALGVKYTVGVDGIGLPLILLSTIVSILVVVYSWGDKTRSIQFFALLLRNVVGVVGFFTVATSTYSTLKQECCYPFSSNYWS